MPLGENSWNGGSCCLQEKLQGTAAGTLGHRIWSHKFKSPPSLKIRVIWAFPHTHHAPTLRTAEKRLCTEFDTDMTFTVSMTKLWTCLAQSPRKARNAETIRRCSSLLRTHSLEPDYAGWAIKADQAPVTLDNESKCPYLSHFILLHSNSTGFYRRLTALKQ